MSTLNICWVTQVIWGKKCLLCIKRNYFISFYKRENWSIFVENECNVPMY